MTLPSMTLRRSAQVGIATLLLTACGGGEPETGEADPSSSATPSSSAELTALELEQGVGPIRDLELGAVEAQLAEAGEAAFQIKCAGCHRIDSRLIAPVLGTVLSRRSPEFVMNMMLNADEMVRRHPVVKELLAEYLTPMPIEVTDPDEARAILEYLRSVQIEPTGGS